MRKSAGICGRISSGKKEVAMGRVHFFPGLGLLLIACISACSAFSEYGRALKEAEQAYLIGDYDLAVRKAVHSLQLKPDNEETVSFIKRVLPEAYQRHRVKIMQFENANEWDEAVKEYRAIEDLVDLVRGYPHGFPTIDVQDEAKKAVLNAAEAHYQAGLRAKEKLGSSGRASGEFASALEYVPNYKDARTQAAAVLYRDGLDYMERGKSKEAAIKFKEVMGFVADYKDVGELYEKAQQAAVRRVAVLPFENKSGKADFGMVGETLADQVISDVMSRNPQFLELVTRDRLHELLKEQGLGVTGVLDEKTASDMGKVLGIHSFVVGKVTSITSSYPPVKTRRTGPYQSGGSVCGGGQPCRKVTYSAWVTQYAVTGRIDVSASYQVIDVESGKIVKAEAKKENVEQAFTWARFSGDEPALPPGIRQLASQEEQYPDPAEVLVQGCIEKLGKTIAAELTGYFE